ncbi:LysR family transcriptional regulator [Sphingopyxis sp. H038]|uniref:LysR family transcriptional regulator n=1 Tax=unclassified Sphingopyxis TaxID=2614943 RepID=UPI000730022D|nr:MULTISPECIES: LysR family transcriptional regulator [unclassified Sphingopyxis]KTD99522.1 LysR family transcriptional regulator [Sphingopyxis sp. H012]KTE04900.1 LysR family transcriptional regulator [Sphingopyxis sp. H093]KTE05901.1 LysR family transcriptional regulator [Sphingopyxis sp. H053]KTE18693.1 LysR family transcriptional regulator [Sphingopyxis sp. H080]KTE30934.1 LysR family transcriptional regulator [Sphingopyxis sp. H038]
MDWDRLQYFLFVARHGTLARASAALHVDATTVSRRVSALEAALGQTLFERAPSGFVLTAAGRALVPHAEAMAAAAARIHSAREDAAALSGQLRVSVSEGFGNSFIAPRLAGFVAAHPELEIDLVASSGFLNPSRREADMAVLLARPRKGPLITRKLSDYSLGIYAPADRRDWQEAVAAAPLSRTGIPVIGYMPDILYAPELDYLGEIEPGLRATVRSSSILAQRRMIAGGAGVGVLPCFLAAGDPELVRVRPEQTVARAFWLALHRDVAPQPRIRAFIDWLDAEVRESRGLLVPA